LGTTEFVKTQDEDELSIMSGNAIAFNLVIERLQRESANFAGKSSGINRSKVCNSSFWAVIGNSAFDNVA